LLLKFHSLIAKSLLLKLHVGSFVIRVKVFQLQVVAFADSLLQFGGRLDQVTLGEIVEHLQLTDDLLLVLHDLVLLLDLGLDPPDLNLLLIGLQLNQSLQVCYIAFLDCYLSLLGVNHGAEAVDLAIESVLLALVVAERAHKGVHGLLPGLLQVADDLLCDAGTVAQKGQVRGDPLDVLQEVLVVSLEELLSLLDVFLLNFHTLGANLEVGDVSAPLVHYPISIQTFNLSAL
jgi:hypothetical protein